MVTIRTREGLCIQKIVHSEEMLRLSGAENTGREIREHMLSISCITSIIFLNFIT